MAKWMDDYDLTDVSEGWLDVDLSHSAYNLLTGGEAAKEALLEAANDYFNELGLFALDVRDTEDCLEWLVYFDDGEDDGQPTELEEWLDFDPDC
jgi:hypothetical protein